MTYLEVYNNVEGDERLEGVSVDSKGCIIRVLDNHRYRISWDALRNNPWEDVLGVLLGNREPTILRHVSRVVGYFSRIDNWNKSKLGELKDRQRGDYAIKGD